ncbi:hypothetical protein ACF1AY_04330 [Streptomyces sp. NPDC014776]|uniref:hypothetical protein n=1 Tax=unclassified Streptomyces TaxID=2593676 RepID=UPI0036F5D318
MAFAERTPLGKNLLRRITFETDDPFIGRRRPAVSVPRAGSTKVTSSFVISVCTGRSEGGRPSSAGSAIPADAWRGSGALNRQFDLPGMDPSTIS